MSVMATKPAKRDSSTGSFVTSLHTYKQVVKASATRKTASPELKALIARGKTLVKSS